MQNIYVRDFRIRDALEEFQEVKCWTEYIKIYIVQIFKQNHFSLFIRGLDRIK